MIMESRQASDTSLAAALVAARAACRFRAVTLTLASGAALAIVAFAFIVSVGVHFVKEL